MTLVANASRREDPGLIKDCGHCGLRRVGYTPDPCIGGYLPGVSHACCGHGQTWAAYVAIGGDPDECASEIPGLKTLRGDAALGYIDAHKHLADPLPPLGDRDHACGSVL